MSIQGTGRQLVMIDEFLIDVSLSEEHTFESEVTEYPVEKGADVTDNIRPKPIQITMEGLVSNTPIDPEIITARNASLAAQTLLISLAPVDDAYSKLMKIRNERETVTIRTSLRTYHDMALKSLVIPRQPGSADALKFTATFVQVQVVTNTRTTRVDPPNAKKSKVVSKTPTSSFSGWVKLLGVAPKSGWFSQYFTEIWLWFDEDIQGWREGFFPVSAKTRAEGGIDWVAKGKPFGASDAQWATVKTDAFWKAIIAAEFEASGNSSLGSPYDPFGSLINVIHDVRVDRVFLYSRVPGDLPHYATS